LLSEPITNSRRKNIHQQETSNLMNKTIILTVVLYGREIWSLTLREEHRLMVFQNSVLRRIFGPKRDES
jgi:hypothetical protein